MIDNDLIGKDRVRTEFRLISDLNDTLKILASLCDGFDDSSDIPSDIIISVSKVTAEIVRISKSLVDSKYDQK